MGEVVSLVKNIGHTIECREYNSARRLAGVLILSIILGATSIARAQNSWQLIKQFDRTIGCAFFFDEDHGLTGSGVRPGLYVDQNSGRLLVDQGDSVSIYKTTDGGASWTECVVPAHFPGAVTKICMIDSLHGYASIFSDLPFDVYGTFGGSGIWETTDGGSTWFDNLQLDHIATSVYAQRGLLMFTKWDYYYQSVDLPPIDTFGGACSYDGGKTWTENFRRGNDIAFSDSLNGVVCEMNSDANGDNFWATTDAGRSWVPSLTNQYEAWSVYAVPKERVYFCANESQPSWPWLLPHTAVNWSTDGGFTWRQRVNFTTMHFTGGIEGVGNTIYFQTDSLYYGDFYQRGLYRSDDSGATWHWVGGPVNSRDTRFAVTGCQGQVVYAFDGYGGVWKTTDGGDGTLGPAITMNTDTIQWLPNPCGDTLRFDAFCASCIPVTVDSAQVISGTELIPLQEVGILPASLAQKNDSVQISLLYDPTTAGQSSTAVRVFAHAGETLVTRDITIITRNTLTKGIFISKDTASFSVTSCSSARDSILVFNAGCPGLVIDSLVIPAGNVISLNIFPDSVSFDSGSILRFMYQPSSAESSTVMAQLYSHQGRRAFDTTVVLTLHSSIAPPIFGFDSTNLSLGTRYCKPLSTEVRLRALSCDSIRIDSIVSSNPSFTIANVGSDLAPQGHDSIRVVFEPDSAGLMSGTIRIYAHSGSSVFDTTLTVSGTNFAVPQAAFLSTDSLPLATSRCQPVLDTVLLSNQGCDSLFLDSVRASDDSEVSVTYNQALLPLASNDTLPFQVVYSPSDGIQKTSTLRVYMHTRVRTFDTVLSLNSSNIIPTDPFSISADSLYLFTKYCQPVSIPVVIANTGCRIMTLDSIQLINDSLGEFSINNLRNSLSTNETDTAYVTFIPAVEGMRNAEARLRVRVSGKTHDTTLAIAAKNLTAPAPYIPSLPSLFAGQVLEIPIMLEPTKDTFSICRFAFHLSFNTDLLTPMGLNFANTCAADTLACTFVAEPKGCSGRVSIADTISDTSQILNPLVYVMAKVSVAKDTVTSVMLDSFATDREPAMQLCSIPEQPFHLGLECGDPLFLQMLNGETITFDFISVAPNPIATGAWSVTYNVRDASSSPLTLDIFDVAGNEVYRCTESGSVGLHQANIPTPMGNGNYIIVLGNGNERKARSVSIIR